MDTGIVQFLEGLPDGRRKAGRRHNQTFVLLLVLMGTMCGHHGYRSIGDFIQRNRDGLLLYFKPDKGRLPSFYTIRRVMQGLDFGLLCKGFYQWARQHLDLSENEWVHIDGKAIKGTMSGYNLDKQRFINLVSLYSSSKQQVIGNALVDNSKESEIPVVRQLITSLGLSGIAFTLDALHCQKKRQR